MPTTLEDVHSRPAFASQTALTYRPFPLLPFPHVLAPHAIAHRAGSIPLWIFQILFFKLVSCAL